MSQLIGVGAGVGENRKESFLEARDVETSANSGESLPRSYPADQALPALSDLAPPCAPREPTRTYGESRKYEAVARSGRA